MFPKSRRPKRVLALLALLVASGGCRNRWTKGPQATPRLERKAQRAAQRSATSELSCHTLTPTTLSAGSSAQLDWYTVQVAGCGETVIFEVTCSHGICTTESQSGG